MERRLKNMAVCLFSDIITVHSIVNVVILASRALGPERLNMPATPAKTLHQHVPCATEINAVTKIPFSVRSEPHGRPQS